MGEITVKKSSISGTSLETFEKRFSNHSVRKTVVSKMKKANLENCKSHWSQKYRILDDYDEADEDE